MAERVKYPALNSISARQTHLSLQLHEGLEQKEDCHFYHSSHHLIFFPMFVFSMKKAFKKSLFLTLMFTFKKKFSTCFFLTL